MKIKCPLCDFENEEGSKFCKNCNEPLFEQKYSADNPYIKKRENERSIFFNSFKEISNAALGAIASGGSTKDILTILKQGVDLIDGSTSEDIESLNIIASLLARPNFGEVETAVKLWERIVELEPFNFSALRFLVNFYLQQSQNNDVYQKGSLLLKSDYRNGIVKDKEIVRLMGSSAKEFDIQNPEKSTSHLYGSLGGFYCDHKDYTLAITAFNIALDINPNNINALNNIAVAFFQKKEYSEALEYYKKCLDVTPYELQKEYRESMEKHTIDPTSVKGIQAKAKIEQMIKEAKSEILFNIGECLFMLNKMDDARYALRKSIEKSEKFPHRDLSEVVEEILVELRRKHR